jgi:hypothetical protein
LLDTSYEERLQLDELSDKNRGNFLEILSLQIREQPELKHAYQKGVLHRLQWLAPAIQNEIIDLIANRVTIRISERLTKAQYFGCIADETSDIARREQVSVCVRFLHDGKVEERFLGFFDTASTTGEELAKLIIAVFIKHGFDLKDLVGLGFDGASAMSSQEVGVAARMREKSPLALYVHCFAHRLNLALQKGLKNVPKLRDALGTMNTMYSYIERSPKRHGELQDAQKEDNVEPTTLKRMSDTRWTSRHDAVKAIKKSFLSIIRMLHRHDDKNDAREAKDIRVGLLTNSLDFEFLFCVHLLERILAQVNALSVYLQSATLDILTATTSALAVIKTFERMRNFETFELLYDQCSKDSRLIEPLLVELKSNFRYKDAVLPRIRRPNVRVTDIGDTPPVAPNFSSVKDFYCKEFYYPAVDMIVSEMKHRFEEKSQDMLISLQHIASLTGEDKKFLKMAADFYSLEEDLVTAERRITMNMDLETDPRPTTFPETLLWLERYDIFKMLPNFGKLVKVFATIPVTSCSAERSFSSLRQILTYLRSTMGEERLSNIALVHCNRDISNEVLKFDLEKIIDTFGSRLGRDKHLIL